MNLFELHREPFYTGAAGIHIAGLLDFAAIRPYSNDKMVKSQEPGSNQQKSSGSARLSIKGRIVAAAVSIAIAGAFGLVNWGERTGFIKWDRLLTPCGFKQRTRLPCPTCGMTTAVRAFAVGRVSEAFRTQPAAALLCVAAGVVAVAALVFAVAGRDWGILGWVRSWEWRYVVIAAAAVILIAWAVTLTQAMCELR